MAEVSVRPGDVRRAAQPANDICPRALLTVDVSEPLSASTAVGIHYPTPVQLSKAFSFLGKGGCGSPVAEEASGRILALPLFPHLTAEPQTFVVHVLRGAV